MSGISGVVSAQRSSLCARGWRFVFKLARTLAMGAVLAVAVIALIDYAIAASWALARRRRQAAAADTTTPPGPAA